MNKTYYVLFDTKDFKKGEVVTFDREKAKDHPELMLFHVAFRNGLVEKKEEIKKTEVKKASVKKTKRRKR